MPPYFYNNHSPSNMLMLKMKRAQQLLPLLFVWLLFAAVLHYYSLLLTAQPIHSANFKSSHPNNKLGNTNGYFHAASGKEMKIHKKPSGPNPIGNQHPPSRP
nr:CLAVATA3/ESR (CLE)-related protein 46 [Ipomoea batatas]GMD24006.1 CLAVATA3/ESR (CLE)-related protein 46 [Ipomoea batatas]GMD29335.1 CLAVATA3/ESR (CLE)-related protein 46 [Ipomoea batatas]